MDKKTVSYYENHAERLIRTYEEIDASSLHSMLLAWLPAQGRLLDIGCGSGRDAAYIAANTDLEVTAADASRNMLKQARKMHPEVCFFEAAFPADERHELFLHPWDAVTALAVLMHIPDEALDDLLSQIRRLLAPGGVFFCSYSLERTQEADDERLFVTRDPDRLAQCIEQHQFTLLHQSRSSDAAKRSIVWINQVYRRT